MNHDGFACNGESTMVLKVRSKLYCILQMLMNVCLIHVTPMQHVTTQLVALPVLVSVVILEMAFDALVSFTVFIPLYAKITVQ